MNSSATKPPNVRLEKIRGTLRSLYNGLIEPTSVGEDERRREYILNIILLGSIVTVIMLDGIVLYYTIQLGKNDHGISLVAFSMIPAFFILLLALSRRKLFVPATYLLITAYFLSESYAAIRWTADMPPALLGYALTVMLSSILVNTQFGFLMTGTIGAFLIAIDYLQLHTIITSDASWKQNANSSDAVVFVTLLFLIMTVAWLSNREIEKSLFRARKSERELQYERDSLEIKIDERTQELQKVQFEKIEQINQFAKFGQLASGLFHDMLNIMNTLSLKLDIHTEGDDSEQTLAEASLTNPSATTRQIEQFMNAIRKQLNHQESEESFSITEGVEQVIQLLSYKAHQENVRVIFARETTKNIRYFGNPFKFHQIIFNLILNGIESHEVIPRKSDAERSVTIRAEEKNDITIVRIEDWGCGIDETIRKKIFDPFFSTKANPKGMGIGLASVKKLIEEDFRGNIAVQSKGNKGSIFTVIFPRKQE